MQTTDGAIDTPRDKATVAGIRRAPHRRQFGEARRFHVPHREGTTLRGSDGSEGRTLGQDLVARVFMASRHGSRTELIRKYSSIALA